MTTSMGEATPSTWHIFEDVPRPAAANMAIDETLLLSCAALAAPLLRFYSWTEPAASFGYFQHYADVEAMTLLRPLVRRPTGGGVVPHDIDWTYSLVFPPDHRWYGLKAIESYMRLHEWVQKAFEECGVAADLAAVANKSGPGQCFAGPEQFDVVWKGRKLAGAAQRRTRSGFLIQGSVQPPRGVERKQWEAAMRSVAAKEWKVRWQTFKLTQELQRRATALETGKYGGSDYNRRR